MGTSGFGRSLGGLMPGPRCPGCPRPRVVDPRALLALQGISGVGPVDHSALRPLGAVSGTPSSTYVARPPTIQTAGMSVATGPVVKSHLSALDTRHQSAV